MANTTNTTKKSKGLKTFLLETKAELAKATWPTKEQLWHNTGVILIFIAIVAVILSVLDVAFARLFQFITNLL